MRGLACGVGGAGPMVGIRPQLINDGTIALELGQTHMLRQLGSGFKVWG